MFYKSQAHVSSSTCGSDHIDVQNSSRFLFDEKSLPDGEIVETIEKNPKKRKRWEGRAEFFLSVIGYAGKDRFFIPIKTIYVFNFQIQFN